MAHYQSVGSIPPKRHTQHRLENDQLAYEELMGEEGFSSDSSLMYHRNIPSTITASRVWDLLDQATTPNHPLAPLHLKLHDLFAVNGDGPEGATDFHGTDVVTGRRLVMGNADVRISYVVADTVSPLYRNGIGDECCYIERGSARFESV
ncbi:MAG: homogentisate 1,2-dioxygenase, partial [Antricoccus sp.]